MKPKYSQPPIRTEIYIINQWEFKAKTSKLLEARENAGDQVAMVFLYLIGWEDAAIFLDQSQSKAQLNQSNHELLSTLSCTFVILDDLV